MKWLEFEGRDVALNIQEDLFGDISLSADRLRLSSAEGRILSRLGFTSTGFSEYAALLDRDRLVDQIPALFEAISREVPTARWVDRRVDDVYALLARRLKSNTVNDTDRSLLDALNRLDEQLRALSERVPEAQQPRTRTPRAARRGEAPDAGAVDARARGAGGDREGLGGDRERVQPRDGGREVLPQAGAGAELPAEHDGGGRIDEPSGRAAPAGLGQNPAGVILPATAEAPVASAAPSVAVEVPPPPVAAPAPPAVRPAANLEIGPAQGTASSLSLGVDPNDPLLSFVSSVEMADFDLLLAPPAAAVLPAPVAPVEAEADAPTPAARVEDPSDALEVAIEDVAEPAVAATVSVSELTAPMSEGVATGTTDDAVSSAPVEPTVDPVNPVAELVPEVEHEAAAVAVATESLVLAEAGPAIEAADVPTAVGAGQPALEAAPVEPEPAIALPVAQVASTATPELVAAAPEAPGASVEPIAAQVSAVESVAPAEAAEASPAAAAEITQAEAAPGTADASAADASPDDTVGRDLDLELLREEEHARWEQAAAPRKIDQFVHPRRVNLRYRQDQTNVAVTALSALLKSPDRKNFIDRSPELVAALREVTSKPDDRFIRGNVFFDYRESMERVKDLREKWDHPSDHLLSEDERAMYPGLPARSEIELSVDERRALAESEWEDGSSLITDSMAQTLWSAAIRFGFDKGQVLLPKASCLTISDWKPTGLPARITQLPGKATFYAVAEALHPEDVVIPGAIERVVLPSSHFDLSLFHLGGEVPGIELVTDPQIDADPEAPLMRDGLAPLVKSALLVRPGGAIMSVVRMSAITGNREPAIWSYLLRHTDVRAVTTVSTALSVGEGIDSAGLPHHAAFALLVLERRLTPRTVREAEAAYIALMEQASADREKFQTEFTAETFVNQYLPDRVVYVVDQIIEANQQRLMAHLEEQLQGESLIKPPMEEPLPDVVLRRRAAPSVHATDYPGSYILGGPDRQQVCVWNQGQEIPAEITYDASRIVRDMIPVRDAARRVLAQQMSSDNIDELRREQVVLDEAYDKFVRAHGPINLPKNTEVLVGEPGLPQLLSLEDYNPETETAQKTDFFTTRVIGVPQLVEHADTAQEALALSLGRCGYISPALMMKLTGRAWDDLAIELKGNLFKDPISGRWQTRNQYLSGNVRAKLESSKLAAQIDPLTYKINELALLESQPSLVEIKDIDIVLGAPWIPDTDIERFAIDMLGGTHGYRQKDGYEKWSIKNGPLVRFDGVTGRWTVHIDLDRAPFLEIDPGKSLLWTTQNRTFVDILRATLNNRSIQVFTTVEGQEDKKLLDHVETAQAQMLQARLKDEFTNWVISNPYRSQRIESMYNRVVNSFKTRVYDGDYLRFDGMSPLHSFRTHQRAMIARSIEDGNALGVHPTGSGKGAVIVGTAMELRALGLAKKPLIGAPRATVNQLAAEFIKFYPAARVLVGQGLSERSPEAIQAFLAKAAMDNWDAVLVSHESFKAIELSPQAQLSLLQARRDQMIRGYLDMGVRNYYDQKPIAEIGKQMNDLYAEVREDGGAGRLFFDDMGVDRLLVDEFQNYKNAPIVTSMNVLGLSTDGSDRAEDMMNKIEYMRHATGHRAGLSAYTATPVCNSIAELYTMMRYVNPQVLRSAGIHHFDGWAKTFGRIVTLIEQKPAGDGFVIRERFAAFQNVPEMTRLFRVLADVLFDEDIPHLAATRPKLVTRLVTSPRDELDKAYLKALELRSRSMSTHQPLWHRDGPIVMMGDLSRGMLDLRVVNPQFPENPESPVELAAREIVEVYFREQEKRGVSLVFCDNGATNSTEGFSVYHALREKLIAAGIPEREIAHINDHNKPGASERFQARVNAGLCRVVVGTSSTLGTGRNVQKRVALMAHLDLPMRPDLYVQRIGRGARSGNIYDQVDNLVVGKEGQTRKLEILQIKARAFRQAMSDPDRAERRLEEELEVSLEQLQSELTDNPLLQEKAFLEREIRDLDLQRSAHARTVALMTAEHAATKAKFDLLTDSLEKIATDARLADAFIEDFKARREYDRANAEAARLADKRAERQARERARLEKAEEKRLERLPPPMPVDPDEVIEIESVANRLASVEPNLSLTLNFEAAESEPASALRTEFKTTPVEPDDAEFADNEIDVPFVEQLIDQDESVPSADGSDAVIPQGFALDIGGTVYRDLRVAGDALRNEFNRAQPRIFDDGVVIAKLGPFELVAVRRKMTFQEYLKDFDLSESRHNRQIFEERFSNYEKNRLCLRGAQDTEIELGWGGRDTSTEVLKAIRRLSDLGQSIGRDLEKLGERVAAALALSRAPFEHEERWREATTRRAEVDALLLQMVNRADPEEERRLLAPLYDMHFRNGRPMHPEQLRPWAEEQRRLEQQRAEALREGNPEANQPRRRRRAPEVRGELADLNRVAAEALGVELR